MYCLCTHTLHLVDTEMLRNRDRQHDVFAAECPPTAADHHWDLFLIIFFVVCKFKMLRFIV